MTTQVLEKNSNYKRFLFLEIFLFGVTLDVLQLCWFRVCCLEFLLGENSVIKLLLFDDQSLIDFPVLQAIELGD